MVGALLLLFVIIGSATGTNAPTAAVPAPAVVPPAAPVVPAAVAVPGDVVGRNAQIVSGELTALGLTNVSFASADADDTVVVLLQN